jgi:ribosome-binding factor A
MSLQRVKQINELIQKILGGIFQKECQFPDNTLVTILAVETSPDLLYSKVIVSVFPLAQDKEVLQYLEDNVFQIQQFLNKKLAMRPIPKIRFEIDRTEFEAEKIEKLLEEIKEK